MVCLDIYQVALSIVIDVFKQCGAHGENINQNSFESLIICCTWQHGLLIIGCFLLLLYSLWL